MHNQVFENCLRIGNPIVQSYALLEESEITLIDGGFFGDSPTRIADALKEAGRSLEEVTTILLSHGHIDHTLHIRELVNRTGASVCAPLLDRNQIAGTHRYRGVSRICGWLEMLARIRYDYQPPRVVHWFDDGDIIPVWGGLKVVSLPGHTPGHCAFYSENHRLLFANDLFANLYGIPKCPPFWFNADNREMRRSLVKADQLDLSGGVLVNHSNSRDRQQLRRDLAKLASRVK